jgi:hypothetical protein
VSKSGKTHYLMGAAVEKIPLHSGRRPTQQDLFNKLLKPITAMRWAGKTEEEIEEWVLNLTEEEVIKLCRR